ncbi:hypothetical protein AOXY_G14701 [Acipenser oxyrinchus oxyrinchus]|uniref:Uncharacterized protein n=1 Tax=Acipenser oxyrinchus oxyrinchus TaxID=40147 RepID=A0AAD8D813_ACIOX|nr:hypothetical protein AOXY_G14701 [Acipenser oxyrinchus oxyrinchus]
MERGNPLYLEYGLMDTQQLHPAERHFRKDSSPPPAISKCRGELGCFFHSLANFHMPHYNASCFLSLLVTLR